MPNNTSPNHRRNARAVAASLTVAAALLGPVVTASAAQASTGNIWSAADDDRSPPTTNVWIVLSDGASNVGPADLAPT